MANLAFLCNDVDPEPNDPHEESNRFVAACLSWITTSIAAGITLDVHLDSF